ncbi:hypothetical protein AM493_18495 [Flavobacterium akiainvivens]|uniref:Outer membrane protein beta-barrel domain-containing protein n=1 Tax=Flavobacterium akiainvivens TaxID=1202724 RepID=A0A0M9VJJ8_9FLAO|nr:outer membrane beta-barrel protein [Flavobacterium akiainvivens]KOS07820.1 hypothetical protein AM493_18495 [Flavobacterium akiainvivens]SFQ27000.1 Outer membrane receptor proteins, mostly Fe transport [Flavobacterium akiainvivens]
MHKILTVLLFLACSTFSFSQNVTLSGKVLDSDDTNLEAATVYLTSAKDSTLIDYTITDKNGNWQIKTRAITQPVFLKIAFMGKAEHKEQFDVIDQDKNFGTIKLAERGTEMDELVIQSEIPPIRIKQDTLEFDAASFKVRPDANVEALLKQLPGVEIDQEGKITVNGKEVNQILVNGKPFFDKDGKVALQNLPAEIINKVQVTDTKTKQEELSGQKGTGENASINLTIDEDKNKGWFGRLMGGYGSDERYESSALINYFNGPTKISLLASSNNINSTGFSMNEIFDSMGGGRNTSIWMNDNGSFGINGMQFGGSNGITRSNIVGLNYADEWAKGFDGSASYFYTSATNDNSNRSNRTNFIPLAENPTTPDEALDQSFRSRSESNTRSEQYAHNFSTELNVKIDSTQQIYYAPKFTKANSKNSNNSNSFSERIADGRLLNDSDSGTFNENDNYSFSSYLVWNKSFAAKKGRSLSFEFSNENRKDDGAAFNNSITNRYTYDNDGTQSVIVDDRNQVRYNRQATDNYTAKLEYAEPITDSLQLRVGAEYQLERWLEDRQGFDFDEGTGNFSDYNDALTNYMSSKVNSFMPSAGLYTNTSKMWLNLSGGARMSKFDAGSQYMGNSYNFDRNFVLPFAEASMRYSFTKSKYLWIGYWYNTEFPTPSQVLPVEDISNPLSTTIGNPDLDPEKYHNFNISLRDYDYATRSGWTISGGGTYFDNQIMYRQDIDETAKSTTTYSNISGTYRLWFGGSWSKSIKNDAHNYRFNLRMNNSYNLEKGFTNNTLYTGRRFTLSPRVDFTYEYGDLLVINPSYQYSYNTIDYTNYVSGNASNYTHRLNLQTTSYWPKHFVFGNDFGYNYNSQLGAGFKKDFFLWNTSLGYNFLDDRMLFKVKVYDLLNQNLGTSRTISATSITDQQNTVLKRYVMFSLTFKLDKFGGKKEGGNDFWFW